MNAEDRKVVDDIHSSTRENTKVLRALSVSLIGKVNGDTVDDGGGRIGRLERLVWWAIRGVIAIGIWLLGNFVIKMIK